jgi:hypothetical protein
MLLQTGTNALSLPGHGGPWQQAAANISFIERFHATPTMIFP